MAWPWQIDENPPFEELGLELSPPGPIPGSVLQAEDGTWVMYLWGVPAPQSEGAVIYRATAPSPAGPWVADPEPVLGLGEPGAWDDLALDFPAVVPVGAGYLMLYGGIDGNETDAHRRRDLGRRHQLAEGPRTGARRRELRQARAPAMPPGRG